MRNNQASFTSYCTLIAQTNVVNENGYDVTTETMRDVFCNAMAGVSRSEFYEAFKAGMSLSATLEIWQGDYENERLVEHNGTRYEIVRVFPSGYGTLELTCQEVIK